jgi:hypothetical protein
MHSAWGERGDVDRFGNGGAAAKVSLLRADEFAAFQSNDEALRLIETSRWQDGCTCPRCQSAYTKRVNASSVHELFKCSDCNYLFNSRSGTIFHGSKLPPAKLLRSLAVFDAGGADANLRLMISTINVTEQTARSLLQRLRLVGADRTWLHEAGNLYGPDFDWSREDGDDEAWHALGYLARKRLAVDADGFFQRLRAALAVPYQRD